MRKEYTDLTILLDRSGSMISIKEDMEGGLNQYLKDQKEIPGKMTVTFFQFDDQYEKCYENRGIANVPDVELIPRGTTALLDSAHKAIADTIDRIGKMTEEDRPNKIIFVIITDGQENSSREITTETLKTRTEERIKDGWEFVYLGANQDAFSTAVSIGIPIGNTMSYSAKVGIGVSSAMNALNVATARSRSDQSTDGAYFDPDERDMRVEEDKDNE